jgi:hypothetical protein
MKLKHLLTILILTITAHAFAQTGRPVSGVVKDSTGTTIPGATIKLLTGKDSLTVATDMNGKFNFPAVPVNQFSLVVFSVGYQAIKRRFVLNNDKTMAELAPIVLKSDAIALKGVTISDVNAVKIKEDTVEYNAAAYKVREGAAVEDVIKKLPGVDVDKDGNITAQGKSVSKVRLNGKDYMAGDVTSLTKNLPADLVQNIQVVDDYGDQANITGIKTGDPQKVLNINIKQDKNYGYFGQATVGGGRDAIPQTHGSTDDDRYIASANVFSFNGNRQIAVSGNLNNTNTNLFNFGGGPGGRGGPGGPPPGFGSGTNGITTARAFGLNYRDNWGKKVTVYGSYSFSNNTVNTITNSIQNNISPDNPTTNNTNSTEKDDKVNHRFNFNIEWKPDTINYFKITPSYSFASVLTNENQSSDLFASNTGITQSQYTLDLMSHSSAPNYGLNVLYNHRFSTRGRNFSVLLTSGSTKSSQYQNPVYDYLPGSRVNAPADQRITTNSRTDSVGASVSYMEPLSKLSFLEFNYGYHYANTTADKTTDTLTSDGDINRYDLLSDDYKFQFITNRFGLNYRFIEKKYNYTLGIAAQPSLLQGSSLESAPTHITTFNFSPVARFVYNFSRSQALTINYNGSSNSPTYSELQPVTDYSSASYPVQGNPDLKPEYNNTFSIRYNKFDFASGNVFFSNLNFTATNDKIVAKTTTFPRNYPVKNLAGTILTQYQNAGGYYSTSAFYLYAKPWEKRKYTLFINGNISYTNNISYIGSVDTVKFQETDQKNIAKNLVLTQGARFRVDITDIIDATANASYSINHSVNSIPQANVNNNYRTINLGVSGKNYVWKDWTLSYDYTKTLYEGFTGATNPNILNAYVERRFLKGNVGTLRFAVNDIFNQNTAYTSTQNGSFINQSNVNRLGRYYMLTFTLRLQKFAGKSPLGPGRDGPRFRPGGGPGPGGPPPGGGGLD